MTILFGFYFQFFNSCLVSVLIPFLRVGGGKCGLQQAEFGIRAWALIHNFAPSTAVTIRKHNGRQSPAERLNQQSYQKNWLHNLLVSAHRAERKRSPPNPL